MFRQLHVLMLLAVAIVTLFLSGTAHAAAPPRVVHVDDYNNDGTVDCSPYDQFDDTSCWQNALNEAKAANPWEPYGTVEATGTMGMYDANGDGTLDRVPPVYIISDTLHVIDTMGGVINGNGATLEWKDSHPT